MLVLAIDTGEKVDKETAWYCDKNRKYYTSKEGYQKWLKYKANQRHYKAKDKFVYAQDLKRKIKKEDAFKAPNGRYYTNEQAFIDSKEEKRPRLSHEEVLYKNACSDLMFKWLGYVDGKKMPRWFYYVLGAWHNTNHYSYGDIYETFLLIENKVENIKITFDFDEQKIKYICKIAENYLNDGAKQHARKQQAIIEAQQQAVTEHYPTQEELEMAWVQPKPDDTERRKMVNETLKAILGDDWQ